jgi:hypothetical protein
MTGNVIPQFTRVRININGYDLREEFTQRKMILRSR